MANYLNRFPLWTALVTPLVPGGGIDYHGLERLLLEQQTAGNGIVLLGSTGEGANLGRKDRENVLRFATGLELSVPLMVGVDGLQLEETLAWMDFYEGLAIDAYLMVTPLYAKPGAEGQRRWFEALLERSSRPCMLYNVPSRTGCSLSIDALMALQGHPLFWSIKEASGDLERFSAYVERLPQIAVFSGDDVLFPEQAARGAHGLISVMANVWPTATTDFVRLALAGEADARRAKLVQGAQALFSAANPVPVKHLLHAKGWICSAEVRPPLHSSDMKRTELLLELDQLIATYEREAA